MDNDQAAFEDPQKKQLTVEEELKECKRTIYMLEQKERNFTRKHGKVVAKLHDHIDKIRKSLITSLNLSLPDTDDQIW